MKRFFIGCMALMLSACGSVQDTRAPTEYGPDVIELRYKNSFFTPHIDRTMQMEATKRCGGSYEVVAMQSDMRGIGVTPVWYIRCTAS